MKKAFGFTLAEVLITLAIIGVVAALTIPSVIANTQQQEFKTGLKKAVSVLNSALTLGQAIDGETLYDNKDMYAYLQKHMSLIKSNQVAPRMDDTSNFAFYTTDGMRFEIPAYHENPKRFVLWESGVEITPNKPNEAVYDEGDDQKGIIISYDINTTSGVRYCGSMGLANNPNNTLEPPCLVVVDVNGDRKPHPKNSTCFAYDEEACGGTKFSDYYTKKLDPNGKVVSDLFLIMLTENRAIPYGVLAQKAMYEAQK